MGVLHQCANRYDFATAQLSGGAGSTLPRQRESRRRSPRRIDFIGLGLIVLGLGCLQVVLDRGQELDWFGSRTITALIVISTISLMLPALCMITLVFVIKKNDPHKVNGTLERGHRQ